MIILALLLSLVPHRDASDFDLLESSLVPSSGELSADAAYARIRRLIKNCDMLDQGCRPKLCLEGDASQRTWEYMTEKGAWFQLDSRTGALMHFIGESTTLGTDKADSAVSCRSVFATDKELEDRLREVAREAGITEEVRLGHFKNGNVSKNGVFTPFGSCTAEVFHKGRQVKGRWGSYCVDLRDGKTVGIDQYYDYNIVNEEPTVSASDILPIVEEAYVAELNKYHEMVRFQYDPDKPPFLCYVNANREARTLRTIAWIVPIGLDEVVVDAVTGKCMYVLLMLPRPRK